MRRPFIAGNWKMYKTSIEAVDLAMGIVDRLGDVTGADIAVCPPFTSLSAVAEIVTDTVIRLGAQNMHWVREGAYTGEISANMLLTAGCDYVILGHSERRTLFHETDEDVNRKVAAALENGLIPIVCVGETLEQREREITRRVIETQIRGAFQGLSAGTFDGTVIAYEPVWAIGTGRTATPVQAQEVHGFIRELLADRFGPDIAETTRIQYGGSMKPENARELLSKPDIDGGLIGGASLKAESFEGIVRAAL